MDTQVLEQLAEALLEVTGKKVSGQKQAATNTATLLFGQGGIFSTPGTGPDVITAHARPMGVLTEVRLNGQPQTIEREKVMAQQHRGVTTELPLRGRLLGLGDIGPAGLSEAQ